MRVPSPSNLSISFYLKKTQTNNPPKKLQCICQLPPLPLFLWCERVDFSHLSIIKLLNISCRRLMLKLVFLVTTEDYLALVLSGGCDVLRETNCPFQHLSATLCPVFLPDRTDHKWACLIILYNSVFALCLQWTDAFVVMMHYIPNCCHIMQIEFYLCIWLSFKNIWFVLNKLFV